jgi:methionine sulfoxide reductase heme-binding subunit
LPADRIGKPLVFLICLLPFAWLVWRTLHGQLGALPYEELEKQTGRWTLRLLATTLAITPARRIFGWNALIRYRRMLGLFVFFYACIHITAYLYLDMQLIVRDIIDDIVEHKYITIGMFAFLTLIPLTLTSTRGWIRRLGKGWQKLHRLIYVTAVAGTVHYLWAVKKDTFLPLVYLVIFAVLLGYRLMMWQRGRRRADHSTSGRTTGIATTA